VVRAHDGHARGGHHEAVPFWFAAAVDAEADGPGIGHDERELGRLPEGRDPDLQNSSQLRVVRVVEPDRGGRVEREGTASVRHLDRHGHDVVRGTIAGQRDGYRGQRQRPAGARRHAGAVGGRIRGGVGVST
jgi:hypothetical protein